MKIVAFFGSKGGTGKSTLSHLLAYGAALQGEAALVVHTDERDPETHRGRPYHYFDGRDPKRLYRVLEKAKTADGDGLCILDGAGNRPGVAETLAKAADLVIVPCGIGGQDAAMALADLARLPSAYILINRWPSAKHPRRHKAEVYVAQLPRERIICRLGESASADRFTESDTDDTPWRTPSTRVNNAARALHRFILHSSPRNGFNVFASHASQPRCGHQPAGSGRLLRPGNGL